MPADLEVDAEGRLRPRAHPVEVRPVASVAELAEAIGLAARCLDGLHELTGHAVCGEQEGDDGTLRFWVSADGYDTALAERLAGIAGCSAFVMFARSLPSTGGGVRR